MVILDVQELLLPLIWRSEELVGRIAALARQARKDGVPVIAFQQIGETGSFFDPEQPRTRPADGLALEPADTVIRKTATDAFYGTDLAAVLLKREVDTVVITGVATDYCVDATVRSSQSHGLDVVLVEDGHAPVAEGDPAAGLAPEQIVERHNRILSTGMHPGGSVRVVPAAEIVFG
ncbi:isochorismatase hydrolase [Actinosynnema sp. ALI-1.44]|nr:isochorismatase hydrolase [Actinosynnema sp. ALI-1.44]